jgi:hypothetical protein
MSTVEEAVPLFRSKGYPAMPFDHPVSGSLRVAAREVCGGADYYGAKIRILQHVFILFPDGPSWVVRDCNYQLDVDERFSSFAEAISAVLDDFALWLASDRKGRRPGLMKPSN